MIVATMVCVTALAAIVIPNFIRARTTCCSNPCINNLRQIDGAKQQWALENSKEHGEPNWADVRPYLGRGPEGSLDGIFCQDDKTRSCTNSYVLGDLNTRPRCKINPEHRIN